MNFNNLNSHVFTKNRRQSPMVWAQAATGIETNDKGARKIL